MRWTRLNIAGLGFSVAEGKAGWSSTSWTVHGDLSNVALPCFGSALGSMAIGECKVILPSYNLKKGVHFLLILWRSEKNVCVARYWLEYQVTWHLISDLLYVLFNQLLWEKKYVNSFQINISKPHRKDFSRAVGKTNHIFPSSVLAFSSFPLLYYPCRKEEIRPEEANSVQSIRTL